MLARHWQRLPQKTYALLCLLGVGVLFYSSYGLANWLAAQRAQVPEIVFDWEHAIPFWAWTIVPYWSLNLLYALAFFLCRDRAELHRYIRQLLSAQLLAISCFILYPLQFSWTKPPAEGLSGSLFASLAVFDQPFNQAPSLHIMLSLIVGRFYWHRLSPFWRVVLVLWFGLIGLSVLTTYQHHFIDIPLGIWAGLLVIWLFPQPKPAASHFRPTPGHKRWAQLYASLAAACVLLACFGGAWLWCLWPASSFALLWLAYRHLGAAALQKHSDGRFGLASTVCLLPYWVVARANMAWWLRQAPKSVVVTEHIHIGSILAAKHFTAVVDVCAEYPLVRRMQSGFRQPERVQTIPMLDMVAPHPADLQAAAAALEQLRQQHTAPVLVCCALGYGRSAATVLTWLCRYGGHPDLDSAIGCLKAARPQMVLPEATRTAIEEALS